MWLITILCLILIIEIIHMKEGYDIFLYDNSYNKILDEENRPIKAVKIYPDTNKSTKILMSMFTDINYCDNLDDLSYNDKYVLQEGFSENPIEKPYLFLLGLFLIYLLAKRP